MKLHRYIWGFFSLQRGNGGHPFGVYARRARTNSSCRSWVACPAKSDRALLFRQFWKLAEALFSAPSQLSSDACILGGLSHISGSKSESCTLASQSRLCIASRSRS